jgi:MSHA biogenesis protein MshJ
MTSLERLKQLMQRFDSLSLRDRAALSGAVAVVIFFVVTVSLIAPDTIRRREANTKLTNQKNELVGLQIKAGELTRQLQEDPVARLQVRREELKKQIADMEGELAQVERGAPKIGSLVRDLLATSPGVSLVSVKTLPVQVVISPTVARPAKAAGPNQKPAANEAPAASAAGVYRHGLEVSVRGNYLALLPYLEKLQRSSARLTWSEARLDANSYPEAQLTIVVFTLSGQQTPSLG